LHELRLRVLVHQVLALRRRGRKRGRQLVAYKPTGNPPGRPRKDGEAPKPKPAKQAPAAHENVRQDSPAQHRPFEAAPCCLKCHPDGWPEGWTAYGCEHGIWARRVRGT